VKPSLLLYLSCINCKGQFDLSETESHPVDTAEGREIISGSLTCKSCAATYPISKGIPRLVDPGLSSSTDINTGERFAHAWREFSRLDERYRQQFFDWIFPVGPEFLKDKLVLEAGVGKGRHAQIVAESGARIVFGIDIGNAIDVAYENVGHLPKLHLIQADIRKLPFKSIFDFAFAVGVLHHMEDPHAGFASVVDCLNSQGSICVWVYGRENNWWIINLVSPLREVFTSNLPSYALKLISTTLSIPVLLFSKVVAAPYSKLREKARYLPEFFYESYFTYISRFDFTEINHIVFDHLTTPVAYYIPGDVVVEWFRAAGFATPIVRWHNKNSWTGFASHNSEDYRALGVRLQAVGTGSGTACDTQLNAGELAPKEESSGQH
jgi:SAM-dependent methyltransferase/uncharacterized protein YbaR (Trm112 family)